MLLFSLLFVSSRNVWSKAAAAAAATATCLLYLYVSTVAPVKKA